MKCGRGGKTGGERASEWSGPCTAEEAAAHLRLGAQRASEGAGAERGGRGWVACRQVRPPCIDRQGRFDHGPHARVRDGGRRGQ